MKIENKNFLYVFIFLLSLVTGLFYWFQLRPANIRSYCDWSIRWGPDKPSNSQIEKKYDFLYKSCLRSKGISN